MMDEEIVSEVYNLLNENYVEDDDNMFRFDYSREFLNWALTPPGFQRDLHLGYYNHHHHHHHNHHPTTTTTTVIATTAAATTTTKRLPPLSIP
jgi:hypothetical protein